MCVRACVCVCIYACESKVRLSSQDVRKGKDDKQIHAHT